MTDAEFAAAVARAEAHADRDPQGYTRRVVWFSRLGYAFLALLLAVLVGLVGGLFVLVVVFKQWVILKFGFKLFVPLGLVVWVLGQALFTRLPRPEGRELGRDEAPVLWDQIDRIREALQVGPLHRVLVSDDVNAAVVEQHRFGMWGPLERTLILGLPLLHALTPAQAKAVLAHEFGHLSGNHSKTAGDMYRSRMAWAHLHAELSQQGASAGGWLLDRFLGWYAPRFNAFSFALARSNEYEADRCAAALASPTDAVAALTRVGLADRWLHERVHGRLASRTETEGTPPALQQELARALRETPDPQRWQRWFEVARKQPTNLADTHPSLTDRSKSLGVEPELPGPLDGESAAQAWLGPLVETLSRELDARWAEGVAAMWSEQGNARRTARGELQALIAREELTGEDLEKAASLTFDLDGPIAARPLFERVREATPDHTLATYRVGQALLELDDPQGIGIIEGIMRREESARMPGLELLFSYYARNGEFGMLDALRERGSEVALAEQRAHIERNVCLPGDPLEAPCLDDATMKSIERALLLHGTWIKRVIVVRKRVDHRPAEPHHVLVIEERSRGLVLDEEKVARQRAEELHAFFEPIVVSVGSLHAVVGEKALVKAAVQAGGVELSPT